MITCPHCSSTETRSHGIRLKSNGEVRYRYDCKSCNKSFTSESTINKFSSNRGLEGEIFVITSGQYGCNPNQNFIDSLLGYCSRRRASLHIIPVIYRGESSDWRLPDELKLNDSVSICKGLRVLGNINISPTIETPLAGLDLLSKGDSLIIGHPQLQMKTLAVNINEPSAIITTTGACTEPDYSLTKQGEKARFNHSYSAIVVEKDIDCFHMRVLNADDFGGFYDIDGYQYKNEFTALDGIEAIITGDEHSIFMDPFIYSATYGDTDCIVNTLKPKFIVRHDVFDCYSVSHHHRNNFLVRYGKLHSGLANLEDELVLTLNHIKETTPPGARNIFVSSNHVDHLTRWLNETDPKTEPWNAKIYHQLMYYVLESMQLSYGEFSYTDPFKLWMTTEWEDAGIFLKRNESYKIFDIEIGNHGDIGTNGSRGSLVQYSRLAHKNIIGHSHSPGIMKGAYQVGTSSILNMEYTKGPSSWGHTHCIIYPNGKRQMINIILGNWRKKS